MCLGNFERFPSCCDYAARHAYEQNGSFMVKAKKTEQKEPVLQ